MLEGRLRVIGVVSWGKAKGRKRKIKRKGKCMVRDFEYD